MEQKKTYPVWTVLVIVGVVMVVLIGLALLIVMPAGVEGR